MSRCIGHVARAIRTDGKWSRMLERDDRTDRQAGGLQSTRGCELGDMGGRWRRWPRRGKDCRKRPHNDHDDSEPRQAPAPLAPLCLPEESFGVVRTALIRSSTGRGRSLDNSHNATIIGVMGSCQGASGRGLRSTPAPWCGSLGSHAIARSGRSRDPAGDCRG